MRLLSWSTRGLLVQALVALSSCARPAPPVRPLDDPPKPKVEVTSDRARNPDRIAPLTLGLSASETLDAEADADSAEPKQAPAWLGVELALRPRDEPGVLVRGVVPGSPAERAGVVAGDIILTVGGESVARPAELIAEVGSHRPGERVALTLLHAGAERLLAATLDELPDEEAMLKKRYLDAAAPAFAGLKTVQGSVLPELGALRGRVVVIEFWATWCVPCRLTAPLLSSWSDRHGAEGLSVVGITSDPMSVAAQGAREVGMSYAVFSDESGVTTRAYRAFALPTMFALDRRGKVRDVMVGFSTARLREFERSVLKLLAER